MHGLLAIGAPDVQDGAACDEGVVHRTVVDGARNNEEEGDRT